MATISTDTYFDASTRTAGETWAINGATLTIRTDTRWHANSPASMTGTLGAVTVSTGLGGSMKIDGSKVRWMPFDTGSGTVPAVGTSITQGGVSGYLLAVYADLTSAPTAVGAAMPASGYLKFREVTGGSFSAGTLSGISANASSADVTGWLEICVDSGANLSFAELGNGFIIIGDWFTLGTTNGSRGQTIQAPTNGGGSGTHIYAVQIETAPGSGVYEWYGCLHATLGAAVWATANFAQDARSKFIESNGNGLLRIGSDGTNNIAYLPPSGCKIRVPNIFMRSVATASRAVNQVPGAVTRAFVSGGNNTWDGVHTDVYVSATGSAIKPYYHNMVHEMPLTLNDPKVPVDMDNCAIAPFSANAASTFFLNRLNGGTISNVKAFNTGSILGVMQLGNTDSVTFNNLELICMKPRTATLAANRIQTVFSNCTFNGLKIKGTGNWSCLLASNITIKNMDYIDRLEGATTSSNAANAIQLSSANGVVIDGFTFGEGGTITNTHCYNAIISGGTNPNNNIKLRNFGTRSVPVDCGTAIATTGPANLYSMTAGDQNIKFQRVYMTGIRGNSLHLQASNNMPGMYYEDVFCGYSTTWMPGGLQCVVRKCGSAGFNTAPSSNLGTHWIDYFTSDTAGEIAWFGCGPSPATSGSNYLVATPNQGTGYITSSAAISLDTQGDYAFSETDYWIKGHTSFKNQAPTTYGTVTGLVFYYDLDTGSGFSGTWKQATGANLSAETISPSGFKMRLKVLQNSTGVSTTLMTEIKFFTNSTLSAQTSNMSALDTNSLTLTGLAVGSEVRAYVGTDPATSVEIGGTESTGSSTFSFQHSSGGQAGYIAILAMGYQPIYFPYTYKSSDDSILIQPVIDRNYYNPA